MKHLPVSSVSPEQPRTAVTRSLCHACRPGRVGHGRLGGRITALAVASVLLADRDDNAGISNYVKLRSAVTCGCPQMMLNVQLAARFAPLCTRILHSYAAGKG